MKQGLLLIDIQNDYFKGGSMELVGMDQAAKRAQEILMEFRQKGAPVIYVQHISIWPGAAFFLPDTDGIHISETVAPAPDEKIIEKHFPNSFRDTSLLDLLKEAGVEETVICGAMSHLCIDATTRAAFDLGFRCVVIEDACATRDLRFKGETIQAGKVHGAFMAALKSPYAKVISAIDFKITAG